MKQQIVKLMFAVALVAAFALPASAQETKIGVVNITALLENAPQTKAAMESLQDEFAPRQRELVAKQKEFEELTAKVQKDIAVMGEAERKSAEKDLRELQREVSRLQTEIGEDFNLRRNEELGELQRSIFKEVQDYAVQEGYDLVVGDGVLYASEAVNITGQVLRAVEASFQATSSN